MELTVYNKTSPNGLKIDKSKASVYGKLLTYQYAAPNLDRKTSRGSNNSISVEISKDIKEGSLSIVAYIANKNTDMVNTVKMFLIKAFDHNFNRIVINQTEYIASFNGISESGTQNARLVTLNFSAYRTMKKEVATGYAVTNNSLIACDSIVRLTIPSNFSETEITFGEISTGVAFSDNHITMAASANDVIEINGIERTIKKNGAMCADDCSYFYDFIKIKPGVTVFQSSPSADYTIEFYEVLM